MQPVPDMTSAAVFSTKSDSPLYLKALVSGGMSVNIKYRSTPITFYTANDAILENLKFLVEKGSDVNAINSVGRTVLMDSMDVIQLNTVADLLDHAANPTAVNNIGTSFSSKLEDKMSGISDSSTKINLKKFVSSP